MEKFFNENKSKREFLCRYYNIQIIRRYRLIPGQDVRGIYKIVNDLVYEFKAQSINYPNNKPFFFHTGKPTGDEFIKFAKIIDVPPVFSLLENIIQNPIVNHQNNIVNNNQPANLQNINDCNKEMLYILNIFFYLYGLDTKLPAFKIYEKIITNQLTFQESLLKGINTIICHGYGFSVKSLLDDAEKKLIQNNVTQNLANFNFNHLIQYCQQNPLPSPSMF
ncbi:MAG: hypothetical protein PHC75_05145 [Burkholderiales bacterium]|nr:hypothetical protein [Burkholderiales bacterium]